MNMVSNNSCVGTDFGNYRIEEKIACGAFGCVYKAQHKFLLRPAAIKLLHAEYSGSQHALDNFLHEARILAQLKHPHILPIYDFGEEHGALYLATEYAPGGSLRDRLRQPSLGAFSVYDVVSIISQIGKALYYVHQQGVIHRDLKPANILLGEYGNILLADFGIAILRTEVALKQGHKVIGTPAYMAPEQFLGKVSRRSDQYALGCITYELMTGCPPFIHANSHSLGLKHIHEAPVPPGLLNANIPPRVEYVILKALKKRRINRYPDVLTFVQELQQAFTESY